VSGNAYLAIVMGLLLLLAAGNLLYFTWLHFRIRAKGYRSPLNVLAVTIPPFAAIFGGTAFYLSTDPLAQTNSLNFDPSLVGSSFTSFAIEVFGPVLAVALAAGLVAKGLPTRSPRSFGARRVSFPWRGVGRLLVVIAVILLAAEWVFGVKGIQSFRIVFQGLLPAILYCFYMVFRANARDLNAATQADPRPPVLYLRAFNRETDMFADMSLADMQKYTRDTANRTAVTFEQYFAAAVNERIGPFVALGSPEDYLPPEGAAREYAEDRSWMDEFAVLSSRAACILMEVDDSSNLQWELASLRRAGMQQRLFVLTRPREMRGWKNMRIMFGRKVYKLLARLKGLRPVSWSAFVAAVSPLGYAFPEIDPGPGAVIAIDANGNALILAQGAVAPENYLEPIAGALEKIAL